MRTRFERSRVAAGAAIVLAATAMRLPLVFAAVPLGYDDGVYASSVMAMRRGAAPFRDIFSSQGPVFLPTLRLFDIVGFERPWAPRLTMVVAGVAIGLAVFSIAGRFAPLAAATAFGIAATTSAAVILATGPLEADGLALALVAVAFAVALSERPGRAVPIAVGVLSALALATKSLFALPGVLAAFAVIALRRSWNGAGLAATAALGVGGLVTLPFGAGHVWDQYVRFHFLIPQEIDVAQNATGLLRTLGRHEIVLMGLVALAVVWAFAGRHRRNEDGRAAVWGAWIWLLTAGAVVVFSTDFGSGNHRYAAFVVVPSVVLLATIRIRPWMIVAVVAVLLPIHIAVVAPILDGHQLSPDEGRLLAVLETIPDGMNVVGDVQPLAFAAGLGSPDWLVDTSYARLDAGYLTADAVIAGMSEANTCAVVMWSGRLARLAPEVLAAADGLGYADDVAFGGGREVLVRPRCEPLHQLHLASAPLHRSESMSVPR